MNTECKAAFSKAKELIQVRKESMGLDVKPDIQNLDSGILVQFFQNWGSSFYDFGGDSEIEFKQRDFEILNNENIEGVHMFFFSDHEPKILNLEYDSMYVNLDGSYDLICDGETTHVKPFSVATFKKGKTLRVENCQDINYFIVINLKSPLF
jgi:hypothetical protein